MEVPCFYYAWYSKSVVVMVRSCLYIYIQCIFY